MGVIKKEKGHVTVCIGCDELIEERITLKTGEQYNFGHYLWYIAAKKLQEKKISIPQGAVKIRFDQPSGQYWIKFSPPGDIGE